MCTCASYAHKKKTTKKGQPFLGENYVAEKERKEKKKKKSQKKWTLHSAATPKGSTHTPLGPFVKYTSCDWDYSVNNPSN